MVMMELSFDPFIKKRSIDSTWRHGHSIVNVALVPTKNIIKKRKKNYIVTLPVDSFCIYIHPSLLKKKKKSKDFIIGEYYAYRRRII